MPLPPPEEPTVKSPDATPGPAERPPETAPTPAPAPGRYEANMRLILRRRLDEQRTIAWQRRGKWQP